MYKNSRGMGFSLPDYNNTPIYSQTPLNKSTQKRPFQPDLLNRSMEHKRIESPAQSKKVNPVYQSLDQFAKIPNYEPTRCSTQRNGIIHAYAANTNQGIVRDYNEDRVSIILNIVKPNNRYTENWPKCSFFGVYDGHGGSACADFLRDNLHQFVIKEADFPWNPFEALRKGFQAAEDSFTQIALQSYNRGIPERSGSCAIVALIVGEICYVANVGDSRAVACGQKGNKVLPLSRDHKPGDDLEQLRIQKAGGRIYQTQVQQNNEQFSMGPLRVLPGRLSVSRTFGDIEAKLERFGGKPNVVIAEPDLRSFKILPEHDFIALASDGIFDKMSSQDVVDVVIKHIVTSDDIHAGCSLGVEGVLKESINRKTMDNITVVVVAFQKDDYLSKLEQDKRQALKKTVESVLKSQPRRTAMRSVEDQENNPSLINKNYYNKRF